MAAYNILEARNNLSRIICSVESGAEVVLETADRGLDESRHVS